jgi:hypothetical protein
MTDRAVGARFRPVRALLVLVLALAGAVPLAAARPQPAQAALLNEVTCTSSRAPWLADYLDTYLENDIDEPAFGDIGFEVYDRRTDTTCHMDRNRHFGSASTVKVIILAALLRRLEEGSALPPDWTEARWRPLAERMIRVSGTPEAIELWPLVNTERPGGGTWVQHFLDLAGMPDTEPATDGAWGTTQITARDMTQLMKMMTTPGTVLSDANRDYIRNLMINTHPELRWGVGQGAPPGTDVGVKIGIDNLGSHRVNLRVHSYGFVEGLGRDYMMAILSDGTVQLPGAADEVKEVESDIAKIIHTGLNGLGWKVEATDKCLDVLDGATGSGVRVQQWECNLGFQQGWLLRRANAGNPLWKEWTFVNVNSGLCLGVVDQSTANGAEVHQQSCHGGTSQRWRLGDENDGARRIWNVKSDKCLAADPTTPGDGGRVIQQTCNGRNAFQQWAAHWSAPPDTGGGGGGGGGGEVLVSAGPDVEGPEGSAIELDGTAGADGVTTSWSWAPVDGAGSCSFADPARVDTTITCDDNGTYTATLTVRPGDGDPVSDSALVEIRNVPPRLTLTGPAPWQLFRVGTPVPVEAGFTDPGNDTHECTVRWDDGTTDGYAATAHSCDRSHVFANAGMYTLNVTVTDDDGASDSAEVMVVVYDPDAGWVNADGSITSPAGALTSQPAAAGESWFTLAAHYYKPNDTVPVGTAKSWLPGTDFRFDAGDRGLEWLVVTPDGKIAAKGTGRLQGSNAPHGIVMYGYDGCADGRTTGCQPGPDSYRVVVWPLAAGTYPTTGNLYDNKAGARYDVDVALPQPLRSGIVTIHKPT